MIPAMPLYVNLIFIATALIAGFLFYRASGGSKMFLYCSLAWLGIQALIGLSGFYAGSAGMPPRAVLMPLLPLIVIAALFLTNQGRLFLDRLDIQGLTWLHIVRIPVEIVLFWLALYGQIPKLMTFEGRNFDIIAGITAPIVAFIAFRVVRKYVTPLLLWNVLCLGLLLNIVIHGILSLPSPFQQFALEQPNVAMLHFPFVWLPSYIVPIVLCSHLASIRLLIAERKTAVIVNP
jgi:hypothetical protein